MVPLPDQAVPVGATPPTESNWDVESSGLLNRLCLGKTFFHSDGNKAWQRGCKLRGIPQAAVIHSRMEFSRPLSAKNNKKSKAAWKHQRQPAKKKNMKKKARRTETAPRGKLICGTQALDATWGVLKGYIPRGIHPLSKSGAAVNERVLQYVYSFQFRRNCAHTNESNLFEALGSLFRAAV